MKIAIFGAAGDVGRCVTEEALSRGHEVVAVGRRPESLSRLPAGVTTLALDAADPEQAAKAMAGCDVAISALRPPEGDEALLIGLTRSILDAAAATGVLIVGGAATLRMPDGVETVLTAPGFLPPEVVPIARASWAQHALVTSDRRAEWSYLCPPAMLAPGLRTGRYRLGADALLVDADGLSRISREDLAVALLDEAETPRHTRRRFTVAAQAA